MAEMADDATMQMLRQQMGQEAPQTGIMVEFSIVAEQQMEESEKAGKPVFKDMEYITKRIPGDRGNVIFRPVRVRDTLEFPQQYQAFKLNKAQPETGTPLTMLPFMAKSQIAELEYYGVRTAEQLVGMADVNGQKIMGFQQLKQKVQQYLDAVEGNAGAAKVAAELAKRDEELALMKQIVEEQGKKIEELNRRK